MEIEVGFQYFNLNKGFKSKNNKNKPKQGFGILKWNLNLFENQAFRFWDFWIETIWNSIQNLNHEDFRNKAFGVSFQNTFSNPNQI
jgi:hypothetical protein